MSYFGNQEQALVETLQREVAKVIELVRRREIVQRKSEGKISIEFPSPLQQSKLIEVRLDSYLMSDFDLTTVWTAQSLEQALTKAIKDVRAWYNLEKDSIPSNLNLDI